MAQVDVLDNFVADLVIEREETRAVADAVVAEGTERRRRYIRPARLPSTLQALTCTTFIDNTAVNSWMVLRRDTFSQPGTAGREVRQPMDLSEFQEHLEKCEDTIYPKSCNAYVQHVPTLLSNSKFHWLMFIVSHVTR